MAYNDNSINRDVILNYAFSTYGTEPEYPWESSPDNAVLRNTMSGKWYAIIMCVKRQILGLDGSVSKEEIFPLIDESYNLVMPKAKKRSKN